jgi:hypothetical protein
MNLTQLFSLNHPAKSLNGIIKSNLNATIEGTSDTSTTVHTLRKWESKFTLTRAYY